MIFFFARNYADMFMTALLVVAVISLKQSDEIYLIVQKKVTDFFLFLDIIRGFMTGVYRREFNDTIMKPTKVAVYVCPFNKFVKY